MLICLHVQSDDFSGTPVRPSYASRKPSPFITRPVTALERPSADLFLPAPGNADDDRAPPTLDGSTQSLKRMRSMFADAISKL